MPGVLFRAPLARFLPMSTAGGGRGGGDLPDLAPVALLLLVVAGASVLRLAGSPLRGRTG